MLPQTPPPPTRYGALIFLKDEADDLPLDFFQIDYSRTQFRSWTYRGVDISVKKRTYSEAEPEHISYDVNLGSLMPRDSRTYLVTVLKPKKPELNKETYKRALKELAEKPEAEMCQLESRAYDPLE